MYRNLHQAAESFTHWRSTREKRSHTPAHLIEQAVSLVGQYKKSQITEQLGINNKMLDRWIRSREPADNTFINITPPPTTISNSIPLTVAVELSHGTTLTFSGEVDQIAKLVSTLRQGEIL